jgi:RNA polymerase sigma factor (sigma-70 family)
VVRCLNRFPTDLSDAELLDRFGRGGEDAAFTLLVQRHGPAVLGVCRRLLGNAADADDAFQATFLVLLRKAGSVRPGAARGCWLYGVASRVAAKSRARRTPPPLSDDIIAAPGARPDGEAAFRELTALLDEEVRKLPEKYRTALILCGLEGKTCDQSARELGWPKSTVAHRLTRARELLRRRLLRRGVAVPAALLSVALAKEAAAYHVPALLTLATVRLARQAAAGRIADAPVVALAEEVARRVSYRWAVVLGLAAALGLAAGAAASRQEKEAEPEPKARTAEADSPAPHVDREGMPLPAEALARVGSAAGFRTSATRPMAGSWPLRAGAS